MEPRTFQPGSIKEATEGLTSVKEFFPNGNPLLSPGLQPDLTGFYLSIAVAVSLAILAVGLAFVAIWKSRK